MDKGKMVISRRSFGIASGLLFLLLTVIFFSLSRCQRVNGRLLVSEVSVVTIKPQDTPVTIEFIGQTQSSHEVEIRARVNGFLDRRTYVEGGFVRAGEVLYVMDQKPFRAQLAAAQAALAQQEARLQTARSNLARVQPLTKLDALSQKDLDDATGQEQAAAAAVDSAKAHVETAELNLGYTVITSPVSGLSSYTRVQEGGYVNPQNNLLTYVYQTDPIWVNFNVSENDVLQYRGQAGKGLFQPPKDNDYQVEVVMADGTLYPEKGHLTFADAEYNQQTGTFLMRATLANAKGLLRVGQFLRVHLLGGIRTAAIRVPQQAVFEGANGRFVWVVNDAGKAEVRDVEAGSQFGDQWFIDKGLKAGDRVIVDGVMRLTAGAPVKIVTPT